LSRLSQNFVYPYCSFKMQKNKGSTMRITMFNELGIPNVFTLESSFCGNNGTHFGVEELMEMGKDICLGLFKYCGDKVYKEIVCDELKQNSELMIENTLIVSDSDSEPSEDELEAEIIAQLIPKSKIKRKKVSKLRNYSKLSGKTSFSVPRQRENVTPKKEVKLAPIEKPREVKKCEICGEGLLPGHNCLKKMQKNLSPTPSLNQRKTIKSLSVISSEIIYVNIKGKTVRNQASQTVHIRKVLDSDALNILNETTPEPRRLGHDFFLNFSSGNAKKLSQITSVLDIHGRKFRMHV